MRRTRLIGTILVALFATFAILTVTASALEKPENLPELAAGKSRTATGKSVGSVEIRIEGQTIIICTAAKNEFTETRSAPPEGIFHFHFEECMATVGGSKIACTGLADEPGSILALGTWSLVWDRKVGGTFTELTTAFLFKNEAFHFACSIILIEVLAGEMLCLHIEPTKKAFTHEFVCLGPATGVAPQEEYSLKDSAPTWISPVLKASVNHAPAVPALLIWRGTITNTVEIFADV